MYHFDPSWACLQACETNHAFKSLQLDPQPTKINCFQNLSLVFSGTMVIRSENREIHIIYSNRYDSDHISYTYRSYRIIHVILFVMQLSIDVFRKRSSSTLCLHQIHLNIESTHAMLDVVTNGHDLHRMERTIHLQKYKDLAPGTWRCLTDFCWLVGCLVHGFILHYASLTSYHRIPICYLNSLPRTCLGWALMLWCHLLQSQPSSWRVGEVSIAWMPRFNGTNRFFTKRFLRNLLSTSNQREQKLFNYSTRRIVEDQCKYSKYHLISKM